MASTAPELTKFADLPCCPELDTSPVCDILDMRRRLSFPTNVRGPRGQQVMVEVIIHTRFERCSGPLALGDLAYTTTLLPGETVRLATTDRRSRFSFDSETNLSWRSEQLSEEQYQMKALRSLMSDVHVEDNGGESSKSKGGWTFSGEASGALETIFAGPDAKASGTHNEESTRDWAREHRAHAELSESQSVEATRTAHAISIGEVSTRVHAEGASEDHFEASSRVFSNPNRCHAVTYLFYRINKTQTIRFELVDIALRVVDAGAPTPVPANPFRDTGALATIPQEVPATNAKRVDIERRGFESAAQFRRDAIRADTAPKVAPEAATTLSPQLRRRALDEVRRRLIGAGILDERGKPDAKFREEIGFTKKSSLPTPGVIVKGCLDTCGTCEPNLERIHQLEIEKLELENALLKRQIELLDRSTAYRGPSGEPPAEPEPAPPEMLGAPSPRVRNPVPA